MCKMELYVLINDDTKKAVKHYLFASFDHAIRVSKNWVFPFNWTLKKVK